MKIIHEAYDLMFYQHDTFRSTPAAQMLSEYNMEMFARGLHDSINFGGSYYPVVWVEAHRTPVGFIGYGIQNDDSRHVFINSAWLAPAFRGAKGYGSQEGTIYDQLFKALCVHLKNEHDIIRVSSICKVANLRAQNAFKRQGRKLKGYLYDYDIPNDLTQDRFEPIEPDDSREKDNRFVAWLKKRF